jgi:uncharacterized HAD superfamily protein
MADKEAIAVDIDEVLFPMAATLLDYYNGEHGTKYRLEQMTSYFLEDLTGETEQEMLKKIEAYLATEHYQKGKPIAGAIEAIHSLREKYRLVVITSRDHFYRGSTERFLDEHFGGLYDELYYTHDEHEPEKRKSKYEICQEIGAVALVDDHLKYVISCAEHGIKGVLFGDYPWNQADKLPDGVVRAKNWQEVLEYFGGRS